MDDLGILTIPAGVIMPRDLLIWLKREYENTAGIADEYLEQGDYEDACYWRGYATAVRRVIEHISYGETSAAAP